ncbi:MULTISPECIES: hypothetical protein [Cellulosimicrobium]|uniref:hypothetical protein n=1 Tax=Cellulosimicrobium TaxID=157920 RepID=UPI001BACD98B|nr:hypothetical protein [Cellulosimicrobium cellulans]QUC01873.1 hypothetical protein J5A69_19715 [Cellulosimicrobium cellulans]
MDEVVGDSGEWLVLVAGLFVYVAVIAWCAFRVSGPDVRRRAEERDVQELLDLYRNVEKHRG